MIDVSLLKCFMKCCSMIFWAFCSCDTHTLFLIVMHKKYLLMFHVLTFCCFRVWPLAFSTSPMRFFAHFCLASQTFWFISLSIWVFAICVLWPSVLLTSFQGLNVISGGFLLSSCIRHEFLSHIWLFPWAFLICSLAVLLRMCYSQFHVQFALYIFPGFLHFM